MAVQINITEAKAKLSSLLDRALAGEEIVIARAGKPLAAPGAERKAAPPQERSLARLKNLERSIAGAHGPRGPRRGRGQAYRRVWHHASAFGRIVRLLVDDTHALLWW